MRNFNEINSGHYIYVNAQGVIVEKFSDNSFVEVDGVMYNFFSRELEFFYNISDPDA